MMSDQNKEKICDNCDHYGMIDSGYGYCRRYPSVMLRVNSVFYKPKYQAMYSYVAWCNKGCGEFRLRLITLNK